MTNKKKKVYQLYETDNGWSFDKEQYGKFSNIIIQVAAVSAKQAVFLANKKMWYVNDISGIIAKSNTDKYKRIWIDYLGKRHFESPFENNKEFITLEKQKDKRRMKIREAMIDNISNINSIVSFGD